MENFDFYTPTRFIFGKEEENNVGRYIKEYGATKVMVLHYGTGMEFENKLMQRVFASLEKEGLAYVDFDNIKANPAYERAMEGADIVREKGVDFLLAVGGGSVIDTAKFIGIEVPNEGDTWQNQFIEGKIPEKIMPIATILTIAATGSEGSNSCVVTNGTVKKNFDHDILRPKFSIMNPELTYTVPVYQTASGAVDMFCHVHERYFTPSQEVELTDELCEAIFRTVIKNAPIAVKEPDNYEARAQLMWAGTLAHNNTCGVGRDQDWAVHVMQAPVGGLYDTAHGAGCGVLTLGWMKYVYKHNIPRFVRYFTNVWDIADNPEDPESVILEGIKRQEEFYKALGMPTKGQEVGIKEEDIPTLVDAFLLGEGTIGSLAALTREDCINIFKLCM